MENIGEITTDNASNKVSLFIRRLCFSIPEGILFAPWLYILKYITVDGEPISFSMYLFLCLILYMFVGIPTNIIIRLIQAKTRKMKFRDFMLSPSISLVKYLEICLNKVNNFRDELSSLVSMFTTHKNSSTVISDNAIPNNAVTPLPNEHKESAIDSSNKKKQIANENISPITTPATQKGAPNNQSSITFPNWYISISFGKSSSDNYLKAITLAKAAPQYLEQTNDGKILHQAIYSSTPKDYLAFIMLYELIGSWKSTFVIVNDKLIDRKIIGKLNYCYGDKCRSGNRNFCYGASYMTENPFGCHRLRISAANNPWWSFYQKHGSKWILDKATMKERIDSYAKVYCICPCFDYDNIITELNKLPDVLSDKQMHQLADNDFGLRL